MSKQRPRAERPSFPCSFMAVRKTLFFTFLVFLNISRSSADIIDVLVGLRDDDLRLVFTPEVVYQDIGQQVRFQFYPQNHSVAQSSFNNPCSPLGGESSAAGFFSGFNAVDKIDQQIPTFTINISSAEPIYFYCAQGRHCQSGMVGIINPPDSETINSFKASASKVPFSEIPLTPPTQDLPSPKFSTTSSSSSVLPAATNGADPQYTPNTPAAKSGSNGLSTSGYIAVAGVGLLLIVTAAIIWWCIVVRRRNRRDRTRRRADHLDRERRRQRGKEVPSRGDRAYRDIDGDAIMIDLEALRPSADVDEHQLQHAYSVRRPSANSASRRHSSMAVEQPLSYVSPTSSNGNRRFSANLINIERRSSNASTYHHRMSMPYHPSSRMSYQGAPSTSHSRNVPSRRHSTMSIPSQHHRQSILRKLSPIQQARYDELQKRKAEQKNLENRKSKQPSLVPTSTRSTPTPTAGMSKWKIFKKSTYRRRMEVREIDIHDVNRHKSSATRKVTPSMISRPAVNGNGSGETEGDTSTRSGTATTAVDTSGRVNTSYTTNSKDMRGGGSIIG
ncbi:hypothetical protein H072_3964 [Dactylellina haptotyla CBS 200.50]|uniref:Phytocyanin domain-containing protein n=1 Tax=Dactylellina haptotyla (strain CBS 200.50) TaxID=1284197 RepID=S8AGD8_DACHA|nr:hypothetical protein H072_3964 [Dactylellina haptotyla CBS 200.50]